MHDKLLQMVLLGGGLLCAVPGIHGVQDDKNKSARQERGRQAPKKQSGKQRPTRNPRQANDDRRRVTEKQNERRRAGAHIASTFPRTKGLLNYLERTDAATYQTVLRHSTQLTRRREAAALRMAKQHHPELFVLIQRSKKRFPRAYNSAIRELVADHARISHAEVIGQQDYDAALAEWKLRSQVRLVAARMTVDNQPELQKQLETLLTQGEHAKRRKIQLQIQRQQDQITRLRRRLDQDPARNVQRQLRAINKRVKPQSKKNKRRRK